MSISIRSNQGTARLKGMLDAGAGVSVMSEAAWKQLGAPILKPWTVPITMANDEPIKVLGITNELSMRLNELKLPMAFIVADHLGPDDFLLGRTLMDLSHNKILIRHPERRQELKRKEVTGSYSEHRKLIIETGTVLKPKEVTLCRLKLPKAIGKFRNDQQVCVLPIKDMGIEANCISAGRTWTLTKDGTIAVPMLNPTDKELIVRQGQKLAYALPAYTELKTERKPTDESQLNESTHNQVNSVSSGTTSEKSTPSGRSNFPAKDEMDEMDLLPDLEELNYRITTAQLDLLRQVILSNASVFAKNIADEGRCNFVEHRHRP